MKSSCHLSVPVQKCWRYFFVLNAQFWFFLSISVCWYVQCVFMLTYKHRPRLSNRIFFRDPPKCFQLFWHGLKMVWMFLVIFELMFNLWSERLFAICFCWPIMITLLLYLFSQVFVLLLIYYFLNDVLVGIWISTLVCLWLSVLVFNGCGILLQGISWYAKRLS